MNIFTLLVLNFISDLYLLSIPLPVFLQSSFSFWKKVGLVLLFSAGAFVTVAGIVRCVLMLSVSFSLFSSPHSKRPQTLISQMAKAFPCIYL